MVDTLALRRSAARRHCGSLLVALLMIGWVGGVSFAAETTADGPDPARSAPSLAMVVAVEGAIGPATSDFFARALATATERGAHLVVVEMDTPGGLDSAMRDMIRDILASPIPVVGFVSPSGARAASAGTYLLYASHVAAMAPATNLGAATPVSIGGTAPEAPSKPPAGDAPQTPDEPQAATAMERKVVNDAVAYIRGLAELRGRNADWAEAAVRRAESLAASDALANNVIDLIAADVPDLLAQINGRTVQTSAGSRVISTSGIVIERIDPDWRTRLLATITNPSVAYVLMLVGVYGLLLEGYNPGATVPGVVGAICLLVAAFAFQLLPVNFAGVALLLLGLSLIVAEAFVPSFGALGLGGVAAFVIGSIMMLDTGVPGFEIARSLIGAVALVAAAGVFGLATFFVRSRGRPVITGRAQLATETAYAVSDFTGEGTVRIHGELWSATARSPVRAGERLRIIRSDGLKLEVEPSDKTPGSL